MSETGVLFETSQPLVVGERIEFTLIFGGRDERSLRLRCAGEIVRLEPYRRRIAAAVCITSYGL